MANLRRGFGEAKKAVQRAKQGFTPPAGKLNYLNMDDGDVVYLRFIDDEPIIAKFYEWIINNQGKANSEFICAPNLYQYDPDWVGEDWVQKYSSPTPGIGWCKKFGSEEIIAPKLKERGVGMAVEQELVVDETTGQPVRPLQLQDVLETIDGDDGEQHIALKFYLVRQSMSNFWDQMVGFHGLYGTICDRPYRIERKGGDMKTTYQAIPMTECVDPTWNYDGSSLRALQALYGYGVNMVFDKETKELTVTRPEGEEFAATDYTWENRYLFAPTTTGEWAEKRASEEYAQYWLDPNAEHLKGDKKGAVTAEKLAASRPADPRKTAAPAPTPKPTPDSAAVASSPPASSGAAEPVASDRFEKMREDMAKKQGAST